MPSSWAPRGRGRLQRALLGSVCGYVVVKAPCPVLVVGEARYRRGRLNL